MIGFYFYVLGGFFVEISFSSRFRI